MLKCSIFNCPESSKKNAAPQPSSLEDLVAARLRQLRKDQNLSLRALAERSGLNVNTLSLIENGKSSPSVGTLQQLALALGVSASVFLEESQADNKLVYVQAAYRPKIQVGLNTLENLGLGLDQNTVQPFVLLLPPQGSSGEGFRVHTGHEFIYCLSGSLNCYVKERAFTLNSGDSLLFEANLPHRWVNESEAQAEVLLIMCPSDQNEAPGGHHFDGLFDS